MATTGKISIDQAFVDNVINVLITASNNIPDLDELKGIKIDDGDNFTEKSLQVKVSAVAEELTTALKDQREKTIPQMVQQLKMMTAAWKDIEDGNKQQADFFKSAEK